MSGSDLRDESSGVDPGFETLWKRVLEGWDDPKTHGALLEYAVQRQLLPEAAGRYRALKDDPERAEVAKKRLDGIVVATTSLLMASATPRTEPKKTLAVITLSALVLTVALLFWLARLMIAGR